MKDSEGTALKDGDTIITSRGAELNVVVDSGIYYAYARGNEEAVPLLQLKVEFTKKQ